MKRTKIMWATIAAIAVVSSFIAGMATGAKYGLLGTANGDFMSGYNAAKAKLAESGVFPPGEKKITALSGTVSLLKDNAITVTDVRITANPLDNQGPSLRTVNITDKTVIVKLVPLTSAQMAEANKKYLAAQRTNKATNPPSPFSETAAKISDIKAGAVIAVSADGDIRDAANINAVKISFR